MPDDFTITPYTVEGTPDYEQLLEQFGADALTDDQLTRFPDPPHRLLRRRYFYAERDLDQFLDAATSGETCSIVTGRGPSGPMHLGHSFVFYFAKYLQDRVSAQVYIPLSDDEKYWLRDQSLSDTREHVRDNLLDLLAVGFNPARTRFIIDTNDADVVYPIATAFAKDITMSTLEATYGDQPNIGMAFYPAVQAAHLLLPQLVHGRHPTLVPIAIDQDPHVRVCRDLAGKERYPVAKPGALLSRFLPQLEGPGKMSSSDGTTAIYLTDDRKTVFEKMREYAYSGGRSSVKEHRKYGGDPAVDIPYQYLHYFFEPDDETIDRVAGEYRRGELLSGELKEYAADRIAAFLEDHQRRRDALGSVDEELDPYRLTANERERALETIGLERL